MLDSAHGVPTKVLQKAFQLGLHNDCVVAGPGGACEQCFENLFLAFDFCYGVDLSMKELIELIARDFLNDQIALLDEF